MNKKINLCGYLFECEPMAYKNLMRYFGEIEKKIFEMRADFELLEDLKYALMENLQEEKVVLIDEEKSLKLMEKMGNPEEIFYYSKVNFTKINEKPILFRKKHKAVLGGVLNGLGVYLSIPPIILRGFFLFFLAQFWGLLLYLLAWIFIPKQNLEEEINWNKQMKSYHKTHPYKGILLQIEDFLQKIGNFLNFFFSYRVFRVFGKGIGFLILGIFSIFLVLIVVFIFLLGSITLASTIGIILKKAKIIFIP